MPDFDEDLLREEEEKYLKEENRDGKLIPSFSLHSKRFKFETPDISFEIKEEIIKEVIKPIIDNKAKIGNIFQSKNKNSLL